MFAYCLNNPTFYSDGTGNYIAVNNRNFLNYDPLPLACGGGAMQREEFVTAGLISLRVFIKSLELL